MGEVKLKPGWLKETIIKAEKRCQELGLFDVTCTRCGGVFTQAHSSHKCTVLVRGLDRKGRPRL